MKEKKCFAWAPPDYRRCPGASGNQGRPSSHPSHASVKAVIFDCDGTLVDSEASGMTALHEQACKLGYSLPQAQALDAFRGRRMALCVEMIEASLGQAAPAISLTPCAAPWRTNSAKASAPCPARKYAQSCQRGRFSPGGA
ncbi:MAG: hypothetical protein I8H70_02390 [Burkholderiales bacterium]|nr:hypothetical protein [Burkholderiales bacterium]